MKNDPDWTPGNEKSKLKVRKMAPILHGYGNVMKYVLSEI